MAAGDAASDGVEGRIGGLRVVVTPQLSCALWRKSLVEDHADRQRGVVGQAQLVLQARRQTLVVRAIPAASEPVGAFTWIVVTASVTRVAMRLAGVGRVNVTDEIAVVAMLAGAHATLVGPHAAGHSFIRAIAREVVGLERSEEIAAESWLASPRVVRASAARLTPSEMRVDALGAQANAGVATLGIVVALLGAHDARTRFAPLTWVAMGIFGAARAARHARRSGAAAYTGVPKLAACTTRGLRRPRAAVRAALGSGPRVARSRSAADVIGTAVCHTTSTRGTPSTTRVFAAGKGEKARRYQPRRTS